MLAVPISQSSDNFTHARGMRQLHGNRCKLSDKMRRVQAKLTNILATSKATAEKMQKECTQLHDRVAKLQADLEEQIHQNTELLADNGQKQLSLKSKEEEIGSVKVRTRSHNALGAVKSAAPPQQSCVAVVPALDVLTTACPRPDAHRVWWRRLNFAASCNCSQHSEQGEYVYRPRHNE